MQVLAECATGTTAHVDAAVAAAERAHGAWSSRTPADRSEVALCIAGALRPRREAGRHLACRDR
jgi:acyl-CoA reductase-like NAD-dependent aldehyde dehydrogenase